MFIIFTVLSTFVEHLLSPLNTAIYFRLEKVVLHFFAATDAWRSAVPHHWRNGVLASLLFSLKKKKRRSK